MRHSRRSGRIARRSEHYEATLDSMAANIVIHGRIRTTLQKAKRAQPLIERLISLGKEGSVHARRRAFRHLQDRDLVKKLFAEIAPRFIETNGGYTRILKLSNRLGDGAQLALLELTKLPVEKPKTPPKSKKELQETPSEQTQEKAAKPEEESVQKPKKFFEGIRGLFRPKKGTGK